MKCTHPRCGKEIHFTANASISGVPRELPNGAHEAIEIAYGQCPACGGDLILIEQGPVVFDSFSSGWEINDIEVAAFIYPSEQIDISVNSDVPQEFADEYVEAYSVVKISAKASAALSRRLLQQIFHAQMGIKRKNLSQEIDAFIDESGAPSYLTEAVDAVRNVGNFAAHPIKDQQTGEVATVEPGEAQWLLEVIDAMFDFVFVQPARLARQRKALDRKLHASGKPPLKSGDASGES